MPFPRKVWTGLLCRAFTEQAIAGAQAKQRLWKDDIPSFLRQIFQDWGSRVSCVLTGAEIRKPRPASERIKPGLSRRRLFLCAEPPSTMRSRQGQRLHVDRMWCGVDGVCSLWCQGAGLQNSQGSSAPPSSPLPRKAPTFHSVNWSYFCPLSHQRSIRHLDVLWECLSHLHYVFPFFPHSTKGKREGGKICFPFVSSLSIQFPFLCLLTPSSSGSCSRGTPTKWMKVIWTFNSSKDTHVW